ncbi:MnhB domain-containing protein, partial [Halobium palmae]
GHDRPTTVIARTVTRIAVPVIVVTAIALLLQGHNLPGGGFIGAVLTATAFVLVYVIFGLTYIQQELLHRSPSEAGMDGMLGAYRFMFSIGLAIAAGAGLVPLVFGEPFLTQGVLFVEHPLGPIPLFEEFEVASAFAFDLGVYFAVVGGLLTIVEVVGRE